MANNNQIPFAAQLPINPFWGSDLQITNGDLVSATGGDLNIVANAQNLQQALQNRLGTEIGNLLEDSTYGVDLFSVIGRKDIGQITALLEQITTTALLGDPRVSNVNQISVFATTPSNYQISAQVSVYGLPYPLNVNQVVPFNPQVPPQLNTVNQEPQVSVNQTTVITQYAISSVTSVILASDAITQTVGDFFQNGTFNGTTITLARPLPDIHVPVLVSYTTQDTVRPGDTFQEVVLEPVTAPQLVLNGTATDVLVQPTTAIPFVENTFSYSLGPNLVSNIISVTGTLNGNSTVFVQGSPGVGDYFFLNDAPNTSQIVWNIPSLGVVNNPDPGTTFYVVTNQNNPATVSGTLVSPLFPIKTVIGVFTDQLGNGFNYYYNAQGYPGGLVNKNTILLGTPVPPNTTTVYVSYLRIITGNI